MRDPLSRMMTEDIDWFTFIFVGVQQVLELCVEDLQVLLDEDLLTLAGQLILR